jgi:hypothetical protein
MDLGFVGEGDLSGIEKSAGFLKNSRYKIATLNQITIFAVLKNKIN